MTLVVDASVVLRWFVTQPGHEAAARWLRRFLDDPAALVGPDLLRFEVFGGLCRLQPKRDPAWAARSFARFDRLGLPTLPTTMADLDRAFGLTRALRIAGYDAVYLAHAERLRTRWLTADARALRRLAGDARVQPLGP
jgi:predicted nucleic acid-binding protein